MFANVFLTHLIRQPGPCHLFARGSTSNLELTPSAGVCPLPGDADDEYC